MIGVGYGIKGRRVFSFGLFMVGQSRGIVGDFGSGTGNALHRLPLFPCESHVHGKRYRLNRNMFSSKPVKSLLCLSVSSNNSTGVRNYIEQYSTFITTGEQHTTLFVSFFTPIRSVNTVPISLLSPFSTFIARQSPSRSTPSSLYMNYVWI